MSENVLELCIICVKMEAEVLKEILIACKNLKRLTIKDNRISYADADFAAPLPRLQLDYFQYRNFIEQPTKIFNLFFECQVKKFIIYGFSASCEALRRFLAGQKILEDLSFKDVGSKSTLFDDKSIVNVNFRLKSLTIDNYSIGCDNSISRLNFQGFLANHQQSLTHLSLNEMSDDCLNLFLNFRSLKNLKIFDMTFNDATPSLSAIENLTIGFDVSGNWSEKFLNVKNLEMTWIRYKRDLILVEKLKKLEKLKISNCCIPQLAISSVKELILSDIGFGDEKPFNYEENQIEELTVKSCVHNCWLKAFLRHEKCKLNLLRISREENCKNCLKAVEDSRRRIRVVQIFD